jgi:hypothetical protein
MLAILLKWHQTISWKLGYGHARAGRPHRSPWWVNEALYALSYAYARHIETPTSEGRRTQINLNDSLKNKGRQAKGAAHGALASHLLLCGIKGWRSLPGQRRT